MKRFLRGSGTCLLLALAACGGTAPQDTADDWSAIDVTTTTYVSAETQAVRAWWNSLTDLEKFAVCDTYGSYAIPGGDQAFVDWAMTQGANEVQAWTLAGVLSENCVGRL